MNIPSDQNIQRAYHEPFSFFVIVLDLPVLAIQELFDLLDEIVGTKLLRAFLVKPRNKTC